MALPPVASTGNATADTIIFILGGAVTLLGLGGISMKKQLSAMKRIVSGDDLEVKANSSTAKLIETLQGQVESTLQQLKTTLDRVESLARERDEAVKQHIECERKRSDEKVESERRITDLVQRHGNQVLALEQAILKLALRLQHLEAVSEWNARMAEFYICNYQLTPEAHKNVPKPPAELWNGPKVKSLDEVLETLAKEDSTLSAACFASTRNNFDDKGETPDD